MTLPFADFATAALRQSHYADHGAGFAIVGDYLQAARNLFGNPDAAY